MPELLGHDERFDALQKDSGCMLSIARLAPQVSGRANEAGGGADRATDAAVCRIIIGSISRSKGLCSVSRISTVSIIY